MKLLKGKTRWFIFTLCMIIIASIIVAISFNVNYSYAETDNSISDATDEEEKEVRPRAFTTLSISINGGDNKVWATVRNDFTLFPSTVVVVVELYSSLTYTDDYTKMNFETGNSTGDLDMGHTISTEAPTGGVVKYWIGRMRYKTGSGAWKSEITGVGKYSATGEFLGYA